MKVSLNGLRIKDRVAPSKVVLSFSSFWKAAVPSAGLAPSSSHSIGIVHQLLLVVECSMFAILSVI